VASIEGRVDACFQEGIGESDKHGLFAGGLDSFAPFSQGLGAPRWGHTAKRGHRARVDRSHHLGKAVFELPIAGDLESVAAGSCDTESDPSAIGSSQRAR
jgi:hypothetical protein